MEVYGRSLFPPPFLHDIIDIQSWIFFDTHGLFAIWINCSNFDDTRFKPYDRIQQVLIIDKINIKWWVFITLNYWVNHLSNLF